jgi:hypothetical protein
MKTLNASEMKRGETYRVSIAAVPKSMKHLGEDGFYYFSVNFLTDLDDGILIEDFENKLWKLPRSQYVHKLTKDETMKTLETLKAQAEMIENKALMYFNELGDLEAYNTLQIELKSINARILDLMTEEQENSVKRATIV